MRTIPIPVDTARLTFTCAKAPRPRLVSQESGVIKTDKDGNTIYETVLMAEDTFGRIELVKVNTLTDPAISQGQDVIPRGLLGYVWEIAQNGATRWGISYKAAEIVPLNGSDRV
ncbi:hypothetical protein ACIBG8_28755 [Nonomuraea sp. NPDC050556]|uniref:SCO3933 family regulatory protein n=1 Tax=Nonomuraea sp. NPDC050556 TaxID=3364369 RepID=UPI0037976399